MKEKEESTIKWQDSNLKIVMHRNLQTMISSMNSMGIIRVDLELAYDD